MIQNRAVAVVLRACAFVLIAVGIYSMVTMLPADRQINQLMYYTIQSNILALILFGMLAVKTALGLKEGVIGSAGYFARFEMICVIDLLLTFSVYWLMLVPTSFSMSDNSFLFSFPNLMVHLVTPLFCFIDYLLFTPSGHLKYRDVYYVCIFPLAYVVFTTITGFAGYVFRVSAEGVPQRFPYFFLDFDQLGAKVFLYIAVLLVIFLIISHLFYLFDKKVKKPVFPKQAKRTT